MKKIFILLLSCFFLSQASFSQIRYLKGILQASQEGPDVHSNGGGIVIVKYNQATKIVQVMGNYRNLTTNVTNQHLHIGAPGTTGGPAVDLANTGGTSGSLAVKPGHELLTEAEETALLSGNMYANVHSVMYGGGELRAQLTLTTDGQTDLLNARIQGAQQVPPTGSLATGRGNVLIDRGVDSMWITGTFSGLSTPAFAAHIHTAPPNVNGDVIVPLKLTLATAGSLDTAFVIPAGQETAILEGNTYINIHTSNFQGGEIRGQVNNFHQLMYFANALNGTQEVPTNSSTAKGTVIVKYNPVTNLLELWGDYQNLSATISGSHIHGPASATETAGVVYPLTHTAGTMGSILLSVTISELEEADLLAGLWYVNIHSEGTFKDGEIRGQLLPTTMGETQLITGKFEASQSVTTPDPPVESNGTGGVTVLLDKATNALYITGAYTGLTSGITASHIHHGEAGTNGPISSRLITIVSGTTEGTVTGSGIITPTLTDSIINGLTYVNIHTSEYGAGEIRAQLGNLVLPLKLKYLNGYKQSNKIALIWESAQEQNLHYYEIEQQGAEPGQWIKKATVFAKGGISTAKYSLLDDPIVNKSNYVIYRLKMVDHDNKFSYSPAIKLNFEKIKGELFITTNPVVNGMLKYNITGFTTDKKAAVSIIDFNGRVVLQKTTSTFMNNSLMINNLPAGMYKLLVRIDDVLMQKSFSK